eukprot:gene2251-2774_t
MRNFNPTLILNISKSDKILVIHVNVEKIANVLIANVEKKKPPNQVASVLNVNANHANVNILENRDGLKSIASNLNFDWQGTSDDDDFCGAFSKRSRVICNDQKTVVLELAIEPGRNPGTMKTDIFTRYLKGVVTFHVSNGAGNVPKLGSSKIYYYYFQQAASTTLTGFFDSSVFTSNLLEFNLFLNVAPTNQLSPTDFARATNLNIFNLQAPGYQIDFSMFWKMPNLQNLGLSGLNFTNKTMPKVDEVSWDKLTILKLQSLKLTGDFDEKFYYLPNLKTLDISNNNGMVVVLTQEIGINSYVRNFYAENSGVTGTVPPNIVSNGMRNLFLRNNPFLGGILPSYFLCASSDSLVDDGIEPQFLFDNDTFTNYKGPDSPRNCTPQISGLSPHPLRVNNSITTIIGSELGDSYQIVMRNSAEDLDNVACLTGEIGDPNLYCSTPLIQGKGILTLKIITGTTPFPTATFNFTYEPPQILTISSPSTLGGWITFTGHNLYAPKIGKKSFVSIYGRDCTNITILKPFEKFSCYYGPGITSNMGVTVSVKDLTNDIDKTPTFSYKSPLVISSTATRPNIDSILTITGADFWNDTTLVDVMIDNSINCSVLEVNHTYIYCNFPPTPYSPSPKNIEVIVNGRPSQPNSLFSFIDLSVCPSACNDKAPCDVAIGFCTCKDQFGPQCTETNKPASIVERGDAVLNVKTPLNSTTELRAYLFSVIENGAETIIPYWSKVDSGEVNIKRFSWELGERKVIVDIRVNNETGIDKIGGSYLPYPADSFTYIVKYQGNTPLNSLQFKFAMSITPEECTAPHVNYSYPTNTNSNAHFAILTKYNVNWFSRFPLASQVNEDGVGSVLTSPLSADGNNTILLASIRYDPTSKISSASFQYDFSVLEAPQMRVPKTTDCVQATPTPTPSNSQDPMNPSSSDGKWKGIVGGVVGGVGAAIIGIGGFFFWRQHRQLSKTQSLLDKKLLELNANKFGVSESQIPENQKQQLKQQAQSCGFQWSPNIVCGAVSTPISRSVIICNNEGTQVTELTIDSKSGYCSLVDLFSIFPQLKILNLYNMQVELLPFSMLTHATLTKFSFIGETSNSYVRLHNYDWSNMKSLVSVTLTNAIGQFPTGFPPLEFFFHNVGTTPSSPTVFDLDLNTLTPELTVFVLRANNYKVNFRKFFNLPPKMFYFGLNSIVLDNTTMPLASEVPSWKNIKSLFIGENPKLQITLTETIGNSKTLEGLILPKNNVTGTVPDNILDGNIYNLQLQDNTFLKGNLPSIFLCMPASTLLNDNVPPSYIFDYTFDNYNGPYGNRVCQPTITKIEPNPIDTLSPTITITGNGIGTVDNGYIVVMKNSIGEQFQLNCQILKRGKQVECLNPNILGSGNLTVSVLNDMTPTPSNFTSFEYTKPKIVFASPVPTLGGYITVSGFNMMGFFDKTKSKITIYGKECKDITVLLNFQTFRCYVEPGVTSDVPITISIKGITNSVAEDPKFFYKAPFVISSIAAQPGIENQLTITGTDFWNDTSVASVVIGDGIQCPVTFVNHSILICTFPPTTFTSEPQEIKLKIGQQYSQPNKLFGFIDTSYCPKGCSGNGDCDIGLGFCSCKKGKFGPACDKDTEPTTTTIHRSSPVLIINSPLNTNTTLYAKLIGIIENGAETAIPPEWVTKFEDNLSTYTWSLGSKQVEVKIRHNNQTGYDRIGQTQLDYPANSHTYSVSYQISSTKMNSLQFKFAIDISPEECDAPLHFAYPTNSNNSAHWLTLTKYDVQWFSRFPSISIVDGDQNVPIKTKPIETKGNSTTLLVSIEASQLSSSFFLYEFSVLKAEEARAPSKQICEDSSDDEKKEESKKVGVIVGAVVGGVCGAAILGAGGFYIFKQHKKLNKTKSLLDKKLKEINGNL